MTTWPRALSFVSGIGMIVFSALTVDHFFAASYPETIFAGSFCDINAFFNCDSSAFSSISAVLGVPLGYFGLVVGVLVSIGALFPSDAFDRTNAFVALLNAIGVVTLFSFSVFYLGSLCLLCGGYYVFSYSAPVRIRRCTRSAVSWSSSAASTPCRFANSARHAGSRAARVLAKSSSTSVLNFAGS